jgi:WD40 repeat protein
MIDDAGVREFLQRMAEETGQPIIDAGPVVRRAHRRLARTSVAGLLAVAALVVGAFSAVRAVQNWAASVPAAHPHGPSLSLPGRGYGFSSNGSRLLTAGVGGNDGVAVVYDAETGERILSRTEAGQGVDAFSSDGSLFATTVSKEHGDTRVYDTASGRLLWRFSLPRSDVCCLAAFSPDDRFLASLGGTPDGPRTLLFDLRTGRLVNTFDVWGGIAFSPDGEKILISGHAGKVEKGVVGYVVHAHELGGGQILTLVGPYGTGDVGNPAWSPDGSMLATATGSGNVFVWDARTGERMFDIAPPADKVVYVGFSPDSARLATGTTLGTAIVWHLSSRQAEPILTLNLQQPYAPTVFFSPDGTQLMTSSADIEVWEIGP